MERYPKVRLDIEGIKHSILYAFMEMQDDVKKQVKAELDTQLSTINVSQLVREETERAIKAFVAQSIRDSFTYNVNGEIEQAVKNYLVEKLKS